MRFSSVAALSIFAVGALALPASSPFVEHERRDYTSRHWTKRERVDGKLELPVRIGLTQSNLDRADEIIMDVASPDSPNYGRHYTAEQVHDLFAPLQSTVDTVRAWLETAGVEGHRISHSVNKQWLQLDITAEKLEELLSTEYHIYEHTGFGKANIACEKYHLPSHVSKHVDYITPGIKLFATPGKAAGRRKSEEIEKRTFLVKGGKPVGPIISDPIEGPISDLIGGDKEPLCEATVTPDCVKIFYNITEPTTAVAGNEMGIFEDLGDVYSQTDLNDFFTTLSPNIPQGTHPLLHGIDGATAPEGNITDAGPESDLDFQLAFPIVYPQKIWLYQTDDPVYENDYVYEGFLNNFLDAIDGSYCSYSAFGETGNSPLDPPYPDPNPGGYKGQLQCGVYRPTNVISISYGGQEPDLPANYQRRQCNEFMKLGLQGVSIVIASGDSGVAGPDGDDSPNGCLGANGNIFSPDFPATCPYVTVLGATYLPPGADAKKDEEVATTRFPSGGGFSNIYPIPSYQKSAVQGYLTKYPPPYPSYSCTFNGSRCGTNDGDVGGGVYNQAGRAYPDFAAVGDNVLIYNTGRPRTIGGTSAATPVFAAILNRINEELLSAGKPTVGFVNPMLYKNPQVLHDITVGSNPGCGTQGFSCAPGWDPVTGLGTPNYPAMLKLFKSQKTPSKR